MSRDPRCVGPVPEWGPTVNETPMLFPHPVQPTDSDERYTPKWIFDGMGVTFDLDPAAPPGGAPNVPAIAHYCAADDGLAQPWHGLVWLNPPFSNMPPWVDRWLAHANGVLLMPWTDSEWHRLVLDSVEFVALLAHPRFDHPTHVGRHVPVSIAVTALGEGVPPLHRLAQLPDVRGLTVGSPAFPNGVEE